MCPVCGNPMNVVCGEPVCGTCFGRILESTPFKTTKPLPPPQTWECCGKPIWTMKPDPHHFCGKGE